MYALTLYNAYIGRSIALFVGIIAVAAFLYGVFLLGAVAHAAGRTAAERQVQKLSSEVSALESTYLTEAKSISPQRAAEMGFVAPGGITTVYAGEPGLTLVGQALRQ